MATVLRLLRLPLFIIGLGLFFVAERYLSAYPAYKLAKFGSLALIFIGVALPFLLRYLGPKVAANSVPYEELFQICKARFKWGFFRPAAGPTRR